MSNKSKEKSLEELIVDLYLNVKIRKQEEVILYVKLDRELWPGILRDGKRKFEEKESKNIN